MRRCDHEAGPHPDNVPTGECDRDDSGSRRQTPHELTRVNLERRRQPNDVVQNRRHLTALDSPDVGAVHANNRCKAFLGHDLAVGRQSQSC